MIDNVPLSRKTTLGTGGPARYYVEAVNADEVAGALAFASTRELPFAVIGLGSNLLVADEGFPGVAVRLVGELAGVASEGTVLRAGGGASLAVCLHRARAASLGGIEFACAIPGTVGGGIRMNAGAYGGDISGVLIDALVLDRGGTRWRSAEELGLAYRRSNLQHGEVVMEARFALESAASDEIRATIAEMQSKRKAAQPTNRRTFGSVFKNPGEDLGAGEAIEQVGLRGHQHGGARISPRHANFIENVGEATSADALALIKLARARVRDHYGVMLETEVQFLGPASGAQAWPPAALIEPGHERD